MESTARIFVPGLYNTFLNIIKLHSFADALLLELNPNFTLICFHFYSFAIWSILTYSHLHSHPHLSHGLIFILILTTEPSPCSWNSGVTSVCPSMAEMFLSCSLYLIPKPCAEIDIHLLLFTWKENQKSLSIW